MNTQAFTKIMMFLLLLLTASCFSHNKDRIAGVRISFLGDNVLNAQVEVYTTDAANAVIEYRIAGQKEESFVSQTSEQNNQHKFLLPHLKPNRQYVFNVITSKGNATEISRDYFFRTLDFYGDIQHTFQMACADTSALPEVFRQGYVMIHRREDPGIIVLLDSKGNIVWYHQAKNEGFKVVRFTDNQTFLCLMGSKEYETGYGCALLELSLKGDTLLYLKKGQNDFQQTIHHEIIPNAKNELVTLCVEDRIMDLRSRGGSAKDTVRGDGIFVMDRQGHKKWKWTVFDALDPSNDTTIVKNKKDWMHANSVSFDKDGNYLVSFYNNGQIWKINARTGKVIWKLGKGGDFVLPAGIAFGQAHAVHVNERGWLQFFDNGTHNKLSRSLSLVLNDRIKKAQLINATWLPPHLFSDRMGSSCLVGDNTLLLCASTHKTIALTNFNGDILWQLRSSGIVSYRAQFISKEKLAPYINL